MEITNGPRVEIDLAGARITIPSATIAELWLDKLRGADESDALAILAASPRIGDRLYTGVYMGIVRGENGEPDYRLIDLGEAPEKMNWADAKKWAEEKGGNLPTRREQSVMFGNRGEGQYKGEWYWSSEQYAGSAGCAWVQDFDDGGQDGGHKGYDYRARAVRRAPIQ